MRESFRLKYVRVKLTSADAPGTLGALRKAGIELQDLDDLGDLVLSFSVAQRDLKKLKSISDSRGEELRILGKQGFLWSVSLLLQRPILILGVLVLICLTIWLPCKILFVKVQGNESVPSRKIAEEVSKYGVSIGADTATVRSEQVKNGLLSTLPELKWVGVNTYGCVAVITVRERQIPEKEDCSISVSSLIASCDGVIESITVQQGSALRKPGDTVFTGETLISGYSDRGVCIRAQEAKGEIIAFTQRKMRVYFPETYHSKVKSGDSERKYAIIFGKKRINFYNGSGILPPSCARIYSDLYVTLPGGYSLPVSLVSETWVAYEVGYITSPSGSDLSCFAQDYLRGQMDSGQILSAEESFIREDDVSILAGSYLCREQIGITKFEETLDHIWER